MKIVKWMPLFVFFMILFCCSDKKSNQRVIFNPKIALQKRIQVALQEDYLSEFSFDEETTKQISVFYRIRNYRPVWSNDSLLNAKGEILQKILSTSYCIGIPLQRWQTKVAAQNKLIAKELLLTAQLGFALHDIKNGWLDTVERAFKPLKWLSFEHKIPEIDTLKNWGKWFAAQGSPLLDYQQLAEALFRYGFGKHYSESNFSIPKMKEDSLACYSEAKKSLCDKGYLNLDNTPDSLLTEVLKRFQKDNGLKPDGIVGNHTRIALEESAQRKIDRTVLSLERWRWRSVFPARFIWINIPEYTLRVYYNDTLFARFRVVVGKTDTKTPQLTSRIRSIVTYPYWTVPYSIRSKEILPELKRNPGYLARNRFKLFKKEQEIDPYSVAWKSIAQQSFPYQVRQEPGKHNALGILKFDFSNPYGVYVHDTPSKSFFASDIRSFSHGCIRCQRPDSLARFLLRRDNQAFLPDSLDSVLTREQHRTIRLKNPVEIMIDYITVTADSEGKLLFYPDVYHSDEYYLKWLNL